MKLSNEICDEAVKIQVEMHRVVDENLKRTNKPSYDDAATTYIIHKLAEIELRLRSIEILVKPNNLEK